MKKEDIIAKLKEHPIFNGVNDSAIESALDSEDTLTRMYKPGEDILSPQSEEKKLGFILLGEANVYSADKERSALIRTLGVGDSFGVSNLFDNERHFVSFIVAKKASSVIFFSPQTIERLLSDSERFRGNYIRFLSQRICFLNQKISCFTAGSPERRLAVFLCSQSDSQSFSLNLNANSLSEMLNVGRASLYRAFDKLIADGYIKKDGKTITLLDRNALKDQYV